MVNKAGDSKREDDAEMETESHALRNLNDPSSAAALDRRSSLDRSHTMPAPSWEEGDQILRGYRLRKAAREAARTSNRASEGPVWETPRPHIPGSAAPSVLEVSDTARSPSRTTVSSTMSFKRHKSGSEDVNSPLPHEDIDMQAAALTPLPLSATNSLKSSKVFKLGGLPRLGSIERPSSEQRITLSRPASLKRNMSDGPLASRRTLAKASSSDSDSQTSASRSSSTSQSGEHVESAGDASSRSSSMRSMHRSMPPSTSSNSHSDEKETSSTMSRSSSIIDHGEAVETESVPSLTVGPSTDLLSPRSLADELRDHSIPIYDDSAYGIPKVVILEGKAVDISEMGILEQVEMLRRSQQEAKDGRNRKASEKSTGLAPSETLDLYQNMPSTDLSVIAERTECSTYSERSTIAPTSRPESIRSQQVPTIGRHLAPKYMRSHLSISTTHSSLSNASKGSTDENPDLTQAERIRNRYLRKAASEQSVEKTSDSPRSGPSTPSMASSHRKYTSVGDIKFHTYSLSPTASSRGEARKPSFSPGLPKVGPSPTIAKHPIVTGPVPSAFKAASSVPVSEKASLSSVGSAASRFIPSNASSSAASGRVSASKRIYSPTMDQKFDRFRSAQPFPQEDYNVSPLTRKRSKSMHSEDVSSRSKMMRDANQVPPSPSLPTLSAIKPVKSTSALVQMFESKSTGSPVQPSSSPVKEWLKKVDNDRMPSSPSVYPPATLSVSSVSDSIGDQQAFARRKAKYETLNMAPSPILPSTSAALQQRRKRSQSLTALPQVLVTQQEDSRPKLPQSVSHSSFGDSEVIYHSDLYWLNSSSVVLPPFWQSCRAILTAQDEMRISWLGPESGTTHERYFDLRSCTAAHSIRRAPTITSAIVQAYDPDSTPVSQEELSKLQVFELVWPGRTQRFACPDLTSRIRWLGQIFGVLAKYSNPNTPVVDLADSPVDEGSQGFATPRSLGAPSEVVIANPSIRSIPDSLSRQEMPRRQLEKETQASLYASVSELLDSQSETNRNPEKDNDLPDIPRYRLEDRSIEPNEGFQTPLNAGSAAAKPLRGAWSDVDRESTKNEVPTGTAPAAKSVARDLKRILTMVGRTRSNSAASQTVHDLPDQLKEMHTHLERISKDIRSASVASRHSRYAPDMISKMDELLGLCKRMAEEQQKSTSTVSGMPTAASSNSTSAASRQLVSEAKEKEKASGLDRLEEKVEILLEVVNRLAASESPTAQKRSRSPERPSDATRTATITMTSTSSGVPPLMIPAAHMATQRAFDMLPSTPDLMMQMGADFEKDVEQWQRFDKKRNSALPPLPTPAPATFDRNPATTSMQALREQAELTEFYHSLGRKPEPSSRPSSVVSSNRVRNARSDAAMRLEGSHPALVANQVKSVPRVSPIRKPPPTSKWSADTAPLDQMSRMTSVNIQKRAKTVGEMTSKIDTSGLSSLQKENEIDSSPPTPRQQDFAKPKFNEPKDFAAAPATPLADKGTQDNMATQLNSMEGLLKTLVSAQGKQSKALNHQEDVSVYVKHLQEYLGEDRTHHKDEFETIKSSLKSIQEQLSGMPRVIQNVIEASLAVATLQGPPNNISNDRPSSPMPPPDNDSPAAMSTVGADHPISAEVPQAATLATAPRSQGKKTGASLLRKVSLGLAGMAGAAPSHSALKVGGPRKMGGSRLFGHPPPGGIAPNARDRWKTDRHKATGDAPATDMPKPATALQDAPVPLESDPQAQILDALEGFQKELAEDGADENEDRQVVVALGILEIIKLLKEQEARQYERDHYHREDQNLKMDLERERHAAEIDAVRQELQQWEARREALASQQYKDPENEEGIERIIALLKDQMLHQELALVNLKETLTPKIRDIGLDSEEAIVTMKEEMSNSLAAFKAQLDDEVKKTLDEVGIVRDQKKQLQSDLSDLLAFKSKYGGGAPETVPQQRPMPQAGLYGQAGPHARPAPLQAHPNAYPAPGPDSSSSNAMPTWGLRGPR